MSLVTKHIPSEEWYIYLPFHCICISIFVFTVTVEPVIQYLLKVHVTMPPRGTL